MVMEEVSDEPGIQQVQGRYTPAEPYTCMYMYIYIFTSKPRTWNIGIRTLGNKDYFVSRGFYFISLGSTSFLSYVCTYYVCVSLSYVCMYYVCVSLSYMCVRM